MQSFAVKGMTHYHESNMRPHGFGPSQRVRGVFSPFTRQYSGSTGQGRSRSDQLNRNVICYDVT